MSRRPPWIGPEALALSELPTLDALEGFDAMRSFLEAYWERGGRSSDDLALLLSGIERDTSIRPDGGTLDPSKWDDWLKAIATVKQSKA